MYLEKNNASVVIPVYDYLMLVKFPCILFAIHPNTTGMVWCRPLCVCNFPVPYLEKDVEFDCIGSWSLPFQHDTHTTLLDCTDICVIKHDKTNQISCVPSDRRRSTGRGRTPRPNNFENGLCCPPPPHNGTTPIILSILRFSPPPPYWKPFYALP